jgi:hypothetical protein
MTGAFDPISGCGGFVAQPGRDSMRCQPLSRAQYHRRCICRCRPRMLATEHPAQVIPSVTATIIRSASKTAKPIGCPQVGIAARDPLHRRQMLRLILTWFRTEFAWEPLRKQHPTRSGTGGGAATRAHRIMSPYERRLPALSRFRSASVNVAFYEGCNPISA